LIGLSLIVLFAVLWLIASGLSRLLPTNAPSVIKTAVAFVLMIGLAHIDLAWVSAFEFPALERRYASTIIHRRVDFDGYYDSWGSASGVLNTDDPLARLVVSADSIKYIEMDARDAIASSPFVKHVAEVSVSDNVTIGSLGGYVKLSLIDCPSAESPQPGVGGFSAEYRSALKMPDHLCPVAVFSDRISSRYEYRSVQVESMEPSRLIDVPGVIRGLWDRNTGQWVTECGQFSYGPWISRWIAIELHRLDHRPWCAQVAPFPQLIERAQSDESSK
jgi:hypothetical protein